MSDEQLVELMASRLPYGVKDKRGRAEMLLAALRSAGFEVFRPEDCEMLQPFGTAPAYYLVPVDHMEGTP